MFCRNCGQKLADGDKFCSACGTKTQLEETGAVTESVIPEVNSEDKPLFEPFDFKAFGFDFSDLGLGTGTKKEENAEESKPTPPTEKFDWNTGAFPDTNTAKKTEDINFNWSLSPETPEPAAEPEIFTAPEPVWNGADTAATDNVSDMSTSELEAELFGDIESKADETRKQSEEIDKFYTFHKKNEEFQKILDREYEKVKTGNIITEEMNAADAVSEEKFTARQPEDPMEELFAEAGVIKGYEPKPVETDVLERIEAAEAEKRIKEEAARIAEEKKVKLEAEEAQAETVVPVDFSNEEVVESAPVVEEEPAVEETPVAEEAPEVEEVIAEDVPEVEETEEPAVEEVTAEDVAEVEAAEEPAVEEVVVESIEDIAVEDAADEAIEPVKTKQVDKAAILAEIALASEMVERDKAMAAAQSAAEEAVVEDIKFDLPDFLGHEETAEEPAEEPAEEQVAVAEISFDEPVTTEEPAAEETMDIPVEPISFDLPVIEEAMEQETEVADDAAAETENIEFDIFEQLEEMDAPAEEIVLSDSQTIEDLFAEIPAADDFAEEETVTEHTVVLTEDSVAEILKTVEEDTTKDDTMVFTAHALGALLAEAEQTDPDAKEVVVSLEELTSLEQQAAEGTLPPIGAVTEEVEEEEEVHGGKGRTFLKICLVILVILLVIEIAGVAIKIAAPTSGAADFINTQLNKVFQLIGEEGADLNNYNA